jgi:hypothetical protein
MKEVYVAQNAPEAYLVRSFLEAEGITAVVQGELLEGLVGAVGIGAAYPSVCVREEDFDRARAVIEKEMGGHPADPASPGDEAPDPDEWRTTKPESEAGDE